jgi:hypothetical protein
MTGEEFIEDLIYYIVLFIYVLICVGISTINYKGELKKHIILALITPFFILIFAPALRGLYPSDNFIAISVATVIADLIALYSVHRNYIKD